MSSTAFYKQNSTPVETRRTPTRNENDTNRRSLSERLRNLFRKRSSSPNRTTDSDRYSRAISTHETMQTSTEETHLRAPTINWPFGKKKSKSSTKMATDTSKVNKTKLKNQKNKKTPVSSMEISNPVFEQDHQTPIQDGNFILRTPEIIYSNRGQINSVSNDDTTTAKGFRDYMVIDHTKYPQQVRLSVTVDNLSSFFVFRCCL